LTVVAALRMSSEKAVRGVAAMIARDLGFRAVRGLGSLVVSGYVYDQTFEQERARLAGMEAQWDPGTFRNIEALGLASDASCWEIGAGGGSVAAWLAQRCGQLLVTDLDTRFVEPLAGGNVKVERHDVVDDPLPDEEFDLVHARLVLEHLPRREDVLDRLVRALRPGGWLLLEDYDWTTYDTDPSSDVASRVANAVIGFMVEAGYDPYFGRRLLRGLRARGLDETGAEGRTLLMDSKHPGATFYRLSLISLRDAVVNRGTVTDAEVDEVLAEMELDERIIISPAMVAAWGRSPHRD
jgi:SAM-dependent methyltransferase